MRAGKRLTMGSYRFSIKEEYGYVLTRYAGELSSSDIEEALREGNRLYPGMHSLVDFSNASLKSITREDVLSLVRLAVDTEPRGIKNAFVAPGDLEYGLTRMYDALTDLELPQSRAVFRTLREAEAWLSEP